MAKYLYIFILAAVLTSCSQYQKALKSEDLKFKYDIAVQMYDQGKYSKTVRLAEQITPSYRGKPQGEKLFYIYAKSLYEVGTYYTAGYQFEYFTANYPRSEKREEAFLLGAKSYYMLSPIYSLDQEATYKALDKLQVFINTYPESEYMDEANALVKELNEKLEKKAFEIAKQYNTTAEYFGDFNAAIKALDNFILDHPGTKYKEDALFCKFDASYRLAINSVRSKQEERLIKALEYYNALVKFKPDTKYKKQVDAMKKELENELQLYSK